MKKDYTFLEDTPHEGGDGGGSHEPSGGSTVHGGATGHDTRDPIDKSDETEPAKPPEELMKSHKKFH